MRFLARACAVSLCVTVFAAASAGVLLEPTQAPDWQVSEWINGDPGSISDHRGKVILIDFFQLWCPGCNDFSIPLFQKWTEEFGSRDDVLVVSIHTVFEGHEMQTPQLLRSFVVEKGITHPVGIDAYPSKNARVPVTMDRYETGGTPHIAIIDQSGKLRFSHFGRFDPEPVERFITRVIDEAKDRKSRPRRTSQTQRPRSQPVTPPVATPPAPPRAEPEAPKEDKPESPGELDKQMSGSYKLRFEQLSRSCGEPGQPVEVITQVSVYEDRIVAKFSRAYLGIRMLTADFDSSSSHFEADVQQQGQEKGGVAVDLSVQVSGRMTIIGDNPEIEYDYYVDQRSQDGKFDCVIEGRGNGIRFRNR
jgi:thiol-disulfide isomerase/thioredoxin